jgi:hypothetical protein
MKGDSEFILLTLIISSIVLFFVFLPISFPLLLVYLKTAGDKKAEAPRKENAP